MPHQKTYDDDNFRKQHFYTTSWYSYICRIEPGGLILSVVEYTDDFPSPKSPPPLPTTNLRNGYIGPIMHK